LILKDGSVLPTDLVIAATGFSQDYSIFSNPATLNALDLQNDGLYLYNYILPPNLPNLAFIGNLGAISNISTYGLQAEWLARHWTGALKYKNGNSLSQEDMKEEIEARKNWARSWMPESSSRGMLVLLHHTHYHDKLLKEMGEKYQRKSNPLSEYLMPYEPADYDGIMADTRKQ
jgi:dimethylaniline monooxygenase (N-oxide forming)